VDKSPRSGVVDAHLDAEEVRAGVTVSMRKMSAGKGYQYLLRSVVAGDGNRSLSTPDHMRIAPMEETGNQSSRFSSSQGPTRSGVGGCGS